MKKKKRPQKISEEFKLSVIRDYYSSGMSKNACRVKYGYEQKRLSGKIWLDQPDDAKFLAQEVLGCVKTFIFAFGNL